MPVRELLVDTDDRHLPTVHLIRLVRILPDWSRMRLRAPYWRCYLPLDEGGSLSFTGQRIALAPGQGYLIPPDTDATAAVHRPFRKVFAHFDWQRRGHQAKPGVIAFPLRHPATRVRRLGDEPSTCALIAVAALTFGLSTLGDDAFTPLPTLDPRVAHAIDCLRSQPDDPPSNTALAVRVGMHPNSFVRLFTANVGVSPQRFSLRARLDLAARLLGDTDDAIDAIASATGFSDRHHFTRAFRRQWRFPPAAYRQRHR